MILQSPWALAGLAAAIPLVLLHLRRRRPRREDVPSLLAWQGARAPIGASRRRLGKPAHPLLLALQLLALVLFVLALARPHADAGARGPTRAYVVDDSIWMGAREGDRTRLEAARSTLRAELGRAPGEERVAIVLAAADPRLFYEGSASGAADSLGRIRATVGPADLPAALRLAAGLRSEDAGVELLRAPEDPEPDIAGDPGSLRERVVGALVADQGIAEPSARCLRGSGRCELFARLRNSGSAPRVDRVEALAAGRPLSAQSVRVPAGGSAPVAFRAPAGAHLVLALRSGDALAADDRAYVEVPAASPVRIVLVGEKSDAEPLARALLAVPGARVTLRTPADFRPADARGAELLVIDGKPPRRTVPAGAPAILRLDPPSLPGGEVGGPLTRGRLSGTDESAAVLGGVDLGSLTIGREGSSEVALPPWMRAAAWSPGGPLLALGTHAGTREALLSFDPADSNLTQLPAFPRLVENVVAWSQEWAPAAVSAGAPFLALRPPGVEETLVATAAGATSRSTRSAIALPRPGFYALRQHGPWGTRSRAIVANADLGAPAARAPAAAAAPKAAPVSLAAASPSASEGTDLAPWLLAAALAVLLLEAALTLRLEGGGPAFIALRAAAVLLLALALIDPETGEEAPPTTVVAQRSEGVGPAAEALERRWAEAAGDCGGRCRVLGSAGTARGALATPSAALASSGTDTESALRSAVAATPGGGRVVLLSDGRGGGGEPEAAIAAARARGVHVDVVPLPERAADAAVTRLQVPEALHAGDPLPLEVNVRATAPATATLALFEDGAARGSRTAHLAAGDNPYLLSLTAGGPGSHSYRVVVHMNGDEVPGNDARAATLRAVRRPRALLVADDVSRLTGVLRGDGIAVTTAAPAALPTDPAALRRFDLVALEDVAAPELGTARARALAAAVRTGATGLVVLGGPHSFSLGGYYDSPLQAALPVGSLKPGNLQRRNLGLEMVLDRSGSMSEEVNGTSKIAMLRVATRSATAFVAKHRDQLGAIAFDVAPHTVVPLTRLRSPARAAGVDREIGRIRAEGGTNIYKALAAGAGQIETSTEQNRHIVLLSDGISEKGSYAGLVPRLRAEGITVSTVALGLDADFELLNSIAEETGGHFYATANPRDLPKIFAKDTRAAARPVRLHGEIGVTAGEDSPIVRDLASQKLPALRGNVVTELKPGAEAILLGQDKDHPPDPALAQWQYGAGRVVTWTPGIGDWAGAWASRPALFADAARWVEPGVAPAPLTPRSVPGAEGELEVDEGASADPAPTPSAMEGSVIAPGGRSRPLAAEARAPWRWTAPLPDPAPGVDAFALRAGGRTARGLLAVPYAEALRPLPFDATLLGPLAAGTGGRALAATDTAIMTADRTGLRWWSALAALVCFLADVAVRLVPTGGRGPRRRSLRPPSGAGPSAGRKERPAASTTSTPA